MSTRQPPPPRDLGTSGRRLWSSVMDDFELVERERTLLHQAARCADACDDLRAAVKADGPLSDSSQGVRAHPALAELRQQQMTLARLLAALDIPADAGYSRQVCAPRGPYSIRSAG